MHQQLQYTLLKKKVSKIRQDLDNQKNQILKLQKANKNLSKQRQKTINKFFLLQESKISIKKSISIKSTVHQKVIKQKEKIKFALQEQKKKVEQIKCQKDKVFTSCQYYKKQLKQFQEKNKQVIYQNQEKQNILKQIENSYDQSNFKQDMINALKKIQLSHQMTNNSQILNFKLKQCLSTRFQLLLKIQQNKRKKIQQLQSKEFQNKILQQKISQTFRQLNQLKQNSQKFKGQEQIFQIEEMVKSEQMRNIQLQAKNQIYKHTLQQLKQQIRSKQDKIRQYELIRESMSQFQVQQQQILKKILRIKIQSQYLLSRERFIEHQQIY